MLDDDDALAGIDLAAWQPPAPSPGTADAVIARLREPAAVPAAAPVLDPFDRPSRRAWWIGGATLGAAAIAAIGAWGFTRTPRNSHDEVVATAPRHLELDGSAADLDAGAQVRWDRQRHLIRAHQARGTVRWMIADDDTLMIDSGGESPSAVTIEASGASLRMEVQMNLSDMRLLGTTTLTAAAVAVVTVVVYAGHVKATSGGQTVNVAPGATVELHPAQPPLLQPPLQAPKEPIAVGAAPADVKLLEDKLRAADEKIDMLTAALAVRTVDGVTVPPVALDAYRLSGDKNIGPDDDTKLAIARAGNPKVVGTFKLCIDTSGTVSSIKVLKSTGFTAYDHTIEQAMNDWRYRPFVSDGKPTPMCTEVSFLYTQDPERTVAGAAVSPAALDAYRLRGDKNIGPDDDTKLAIARAGNPKVVGTFKLCVDTSGTVSSVKMLKSTGFAAYDHTIEQAMNDWRYRPFVSDGKPTPVCTEVTYIYDNQ